MEALGGEDVQLLLIHDSTRWGVSGQRHAPAALYPRGEDPRYLCRGPNPDHPVVQSVVRPYTD
jgi:hypothetical protein